MWLHTFLNYNFIRFPVELLICESVFLIKKERKENFNIRLVVSLLLYFFLTLSWERLMAPFCEQNLFFYVLLYLGYAVLTVFPILVSFDVTLLELVFILAGGYATEHMSFAMITIIAYLIHEDNNSNILIYQIITNYLVYIVGAFLVYFLIIRANQDKGEFRKGDARIGVLGLVLMIAAIGLSVYYSYPLEYVGTLIGSVICPAYSFLCCILVLILEYYILRENHMKREQEMMEHSLQMVNAQQKSSREAINIINLKCHDLKHQIRLLAKLSDASERSKYVQEIQQAVSIYDAVYHTGCEALDYVLREKTLISNEYHVTFSCMVEGELLSFLSPADIYALMGNALDNALERVLQEVEEERIISLQIKRCGDMVLIHLENRCSRVPEFQDGLPVTDKKDKDYHGFGVKSIRYIAEKYGGESFMQVQDGNFCMDVLLPMK